MLPPKEDLIADVNFIHFSTVQKNVQLFPYNKYDQMKYDNKYMTFRNYV